MTIRITAVCLSAIGANFSSQASLRDAFRCSDTRPDEMDADKKQITFNSIFPDNSATPEPPLP